jgi:hypothetical protein
MYMKNITNSYLWSLRLELQNKKFDFSFDEDCDDPIKVMKDIR